MINDQGSLGIIIGGSGNGEQVAATKLPGFRAAVAWTDETAQLARQHNHANVLSLGARMYTIDDAIGFARIFLSTPFSGEPRHARRLAEITDYEKTGELPPRLLTWLAQFLPHRYPTSPTSPPPPATSDIHARSNI